jgi:exodeoxyribonuclease III
MKIATFNINGIKARIEALPRWLEAARPDVACLQEIKSVDEAFPASVRGHGLPRRNPRAKGVQRRGDPVALPLEDVTRGLPGDDATNRPAGSRPR